MVILISLPDFLFSVTCHPVFSLSVMERIMRKTLPCAVPIQLE
jgi:hypothetical protein